MKAVDSISNSDKINYLNIGLMLLSLGVAFCVPFELFLFSYAILGPAHYLTEISWLHQRNYFSKGKYDYVFLGVAGLLLFSLIYITPKLDLFDDTTTSLFSTGLVYIAFAASLAMVLLKSSFYRFIAFIAICVTSIIAKNNSVVLIFSVFLPTLIHVFLFTFFFMLYGALKGRSRSGYLSCIVLLICPLLIIFITPSSLPVTDYAMQSYSLFDTINKTMLQIFNPGLFVHKFNTIQAYHDYMHQVIFQSLPGLVIMRFIAFAYTYHYLNWFSKTSIIKWHNVPKKRLIIIGVLWIASVGFYLYNYRLGFNVLFLLSFLHVFLEFPLNHVTIIGIFKEAGDIYRGKKPVPVIARSKKK